MRPVFCGNFDFDARQSDLERLFSKYGPIRRIDMKSGTHRNSLPPLLSVQSVSNLRDKRNAAWPMSV
jgi:RNA recognition motif-containing protein